MKKEEKFKKRKAKKIAAKLMEATAAGIDISGEAIRHQETLAQMEAYKKPAYVQQYEKPSKTTNVDDAVKKMLEENKAKAEMAHQVEMARKEAQRKELLKKEIKTKKVEPLKKQRLIDAKKQKKESIGKRMVSQLKEKSKITKKETGAKKFDKPAPVSLAKPSVKEFKKPVSTGSSKPAEIKSLPKPVMKKELPPPQKRMDAPKKLK